MYASPTIETQRWRSRVCLFVFILTHSAFYRPLPLSKMPIVVCAFGFLTIGRCRVTCGMSISTVVMLMVGSRCASCIAAGIGDSHTRETDANVEWHTSCTLNGCIGVQLGC